MRRPSNSLYGSIHLLTSILCSRYRPVYKSKAILTCTLRLRSRRWVEGSLGNWARHAYLGTLSSNGRGTIMHPATTPRVESVNVGLPREVLWKGRTVLTSIFKEPMTGRIALRRLNLQGDQQADLKVHGG